MDEKKAPQTHDSGVLSTQVVCGAVRVAAWLVAGLLGAGACQSRDESARRSPPERGAAAIERSAAQHARDGLPLPELDRVLLAALAQPEQSVQGPALAGMLASCAGVAADTQRQELLRRVLLRHAQPSMVPALARQLARPLPGLREASSPSAIELRQCESFRQALAIELLGVIAAPASVEPLLAVLFDPAKAELHALCSLALLRVGPAAERRAAALLEASSERLPALAGLLGQMRTVRACAALAAALERSSAVEARARLAIELIRCRDPALIGKYQAVYAATPRDLELGPGVLAHDALAEAVVGAFDASVVPWLLERVPGAPQRGGSGTLEQSSELFAAIRLMTLEQLPAVKKVVQRRRLRQELEVFTQAATQLQSCERLLSCYIVALSEAAHQEGTRQVRGIKAAVMLGVLGDEPARDAIVRRYPRIQSAVIRFWAAQAIGHLTRAPSQATLRALTQVLTAGDAGESHDLALEQVLWRLRLAQAR
jgi:hypothetical protein